jgi:hypothetical protein
MTYDEWLLHAKSALTAKNVSSEHYYIQLSVNKQELFVE